VILTVRFYMLCCLLCTTQAASAKAEGNEFYKAGLYTKALEAYSRAVQSDPSVAAYYGNRAATLMMLKRFEDALGRRVCRGIHPVCSVCVADTWVHHNPHVYAHVHPHTFIYLYPPPPPPSVSQLTARPP
jgi:hypothetical protein